MYWKEGSTVLLVLAKYFQIFKNDSKQLKKKDFRPQNWYFINNGWFLVVGRSLNNRNILESGISVTKFNFSLSILFSGSPQIEYWLRFQPWFSVVDSILATSIATRNWRKLEGRIQFAKVSYQQNGLLHNRSFIVQYKFCNHVNCVNLLFPKPFPTKPIYLLLGIRNVYLVPNWLKSLPSR